MLCGHVVGEFVGELLGAVEFRHASGLVGRFLTRRRLLRGGHRLLFACCLLEPQLLNPGELHGGLGSLAADFRGCLRERLGRFRRLVLRDRWHSLLDRRGRLRSCVFDRFGHLLRHCGHVLLLGLDRGSIGLRLPGIRRGLLGGAGQFPFGGGSPIDRLRSPREFGDLRGRLSPLHVGNRILRMAAIFSLRGMRSGRFQFLKRLGELLSRLRLRHLVSGHWFTGGIVALSRLGQDRLGGSLCVVARDHLGGGLGRLGHEARAEWRRRFVGR